jgi:hypothetical protein
MMRRSIRNLRSPLVPIAAIAAQAMFEASEVDTAWRGQVFLGTVGKGMSPVCRLAAITFD